MAPDPTASTLHDLLAGVPFFRDLTPEELGRIITLGRLVTYPKDAVLFKEGDPGEALYILHEDPVIARKVLWTLCRILSLRLRETTDRIVALFAIITRPF